MRKVAWVSFWVLATLAVHFLAAKWIGRALLTNDGYQYLDAAGHLLARNGLATSVAHFDEQVAWGKLPVPLTHFPPGYPIAIAAVAALGLVPLDAAYILSIAGFVGTTLLLLHAWRRLGLEPFAAAMLCLVWIGNGYALLFSTVLGPGALFIVCTTGFAVCILLDLQADGRRPWLLLLMGLAIGLSFALRYAGLFFIPSLGMYLAWRAWRTPTARSLAFGGAAMAALLAIPILVRNTVITGTWRGGHSSGNGHTVAEVAREFLTAPFHIGLGDNAPISTGLWTALLLATGCFLVWTLAARWKTPPPPVWPAYTLPALVWFAILSGGYVAGIVLTELTTIAAATHYYLPVYPIVLIAAGMAFRLATSVRARVALVLCVLPVLAVNALSVVYPRSLSSEREVARLMNGEVEPGVPLRQWLQGRLRPGSVLFSTNGQAVYWVLRQPVVSIIDGGSTSQEWTPAALRDLMAKYRATYLMVFPAADRYAVLEQYNIPLFGQLAAGESPEWLRIAARTPGVIVYECSGCAQPR